MKCDREYARDNTEQSVSIKTGSPGLTARSPIIPDIPVTCYGGRL